MNKFAISKYIPNKKVANIPFSIQLKFNSYDNPENILKNSETSTFNNESFDDFCLKYDLPLNTYIKFFSIGLTNYNTNETIGFADAFYINTNLLKKDNLDIESFLDMLNSANIDFSLSQYFEMILNINAEISEFGNGNIIISNMHILKQYRNKGFGNYLLTNIPIMIERHIGLYFEKIIGFFNPSINSEDLKRLGDDEEKIIKFINTNKSICEHLFNCNKYKILYQTSNSELFYKNY